MDSILGLMSSLSLNGKKIDEHDSNLNLTSATINDIETEIIYGVYTDHIILIASQYAKLGSLFSVQKDETDLNGDRICEPVYTVKTLFGCGDLVQEAAVRFLAEKLAIDRKTLAFISLKEYSPEMLHSILEIINKF